MSVDRLTKTEMLKMMMDYMKRSLGHASPSKHELRNGSQGWHKDQMKPDKPK